jgi:calcium-translocating P-type ATPase
MNIHQLSVDDALATLASGTAGLSSPEAARRLREQGPNRVEKALRQPTSWRLLKEFFGFFSVILWCAAGLAFLAEWFDPGQGMARIGYAVIIVILVSGIFSFWQEMRIERTLAALQRLLPENVSALRDGVIVQVPAEALVVGDVILLEAGNNVPADCRLIEGFGVGVNNATVTGESLSRTLDAAPSAAENLVAARNVLLAGTSVVSGQARALVFAAGARTEFGKIAHLSQVDDTPSPLRRQLAFLSRVIAASAIGIGLLFFTVGALIGVPFWQDFIFSIGIIVALVPEGLLPTLTLTLVLAARRMAKRNVLIRHLPSVETLGSATVICTDKTGTLTENRMHVRELWLAGERLAATALPGNAELAQRHREFFNCAGLCHDVKQSERDGQPVLLGDPMEIALVEMARAFVAAPSARRLDELSFDSDRMRQSVVHDMPEGPVLYCKGAPESVLALCDSIRAQDQIKALDQPMRLRIVEAQEAMAGQGLRVIAFATKRLPAGFSPTSFSIPSLEQGLVFLGLAGLEDPPRGEVPEAIGRCREAGIAVIMVTGDHPQTATAIARKIGLVRSERPYVITGEQLRRLPPADLARALDEPELIFARVAADQKVRIVQALIDKKHIVAVTGDGVNDAPALKCAHIGIAMGISGTDVAKEAADMVLIDDNFASIVNAVEEGRAVFQNIRKFLTYVLVHNVAELVPFLAFALFKIPLPLTPIQVLSIDMGTDSLTALGLGVERPDPKDMRQPPRSPSEKLLSLPVALRAYLFLGVIEAAAAMAAYFLVLLAGGWHYGDALASDDPLYLRATTACLSAIVVMQIANVLLCRSATRSAFSTGLLDNRLIVWGIVLEIALLLAINYLPIGNWLLDTSPVPAGLWPVLIVFAAGMLTLEELRKWIARRRDRSPGA